MYLEFCSRYVGKFKICPDVFCVFRLEAFLGRPARQRAVGQRAGQRADYAGQPAGMLAGSF